VCVCVCGEGKKPSLDFLSQLTFCDWCMKYAVTIATVVNVNPQLRVEY